MRGNFYNASCPSWNTPVPIWHRGRMEIGDHRFEWEAKVYPTGSPLGIDGGRILKLWVAELDKSAPIRREVALYERGWCTEPATPEAKQAVAQVLEMFTQASGTKEQEDQR